MRTARRSAGNHSREFTGPDSIESAKEEVIALVDYCRNHEGHILKDERPEEAKPAARRQEEPNRRRRDKGKGDRTDKGGKAGKGGKDAESLGGTQRFGMAGKPAG